MQIFPFFFFSALQKFLLEILKPSWASGPFKAQPKTQQLPRTSAVMMLYRLPRIPDAVVLFLARAAERRLQPSKRAPGHHTSQFSPNLVVNLLPLLHFPLLNCRGVVIHRILDFFHW
jgi:hypothetical protein